MSNVDNMEVWYKYLWIFPWKEAGKSSKFPYAGGEMGFLEGDVGKKGTGSGRKRTDIPSFFSSACLM